MERNKKIFAVVSVVAIVVGLVSVLDHMEPGDGAETIGEWIVGFLLWLLVGSIHGGTICVLNEIVYMILHWRDEQIKLRSPESEEEIEFALVFGMGATLAIYTVVYAIEVLAKII